MKHENEVKRDKNEVKNEKKEGKRVEKEVKKEKKEVKIGRPPNATVSGICCPNAEEWA
jgi:hypothetical protein